MKHPNLTKIATAFALLIVSASSLAETEQAIFAGGCFWCTEADFEKVPGVLSAVSGYIDGHVENPSYKQVSAGQTGHTEAVKISFDNTQVSYAQLLTYFWRTIDPLVKNRQFCDIGSQYRTGIFTLDEEQKEMAVASKKQVQNQLGERIYTEISAESKFWPAEDYHQDYYNSSFGVQKQR